MPTTTTFAHRRRRLVLEPDANSDAIVRVLTLLRRRGCTILSVNFQRADRHGPGTFEVSVEAPGRIEHCLESWLMGLVDVRAVETGV